MVQNSPYFANFLRETRERRQWSQQQVDDAGGPYRQMQAKIENNEESDIREQFLAMFDCAYGWPYGYAQAVAEIGEHSETHGLSDALDGGERDARALQGYNPEPPADVRKTFAGLYEKPVPEGSYSPATLGFDPTTGSQQYLEGPLLTNVPFAHLHPMILARHGVTMIDANVVDDRSMDVVASVYAAGAIPESLAQKRPLYRTGTSRPNHATAIGIDPLSEITTLTDAKLLAEALRRIRPEVPTTTLRAAFTLLAIVAFGEDPIVTMTQLKRRGTDTSGAEFNARFETFWQSFYDPTKAGPDLARPDPHACDLLAGVLAGRDEGLGVEIGRAQGQRHPRYDVARTLRPDEIVASSIVEPAIVFYDGQVAPELPVAFSYLWIAEALTFYAAEIVPGGGVRPALGPRAPFMSVGITTADDRDVIAEQRPGERATLTNYMEGQAICCEGGHARRVWIPRV